MSWWSVVYVSDRGQEEFSIVRKDVGVVIKLVRWKVSWRRWVFWSFPMWRNRLYSGNPILASRRFTDQLIRCKTIIRSVKYVIMSLPKQLFLSNKISLYLAFIYLFSRYIVVYFSILYLRYHAGIVTDEMLSTPKAPYVAVGFLEALAAATGMAAGGRYPF